MDVAAETPPPIGAPRAGTLKLAAWERGSHHLELRFALAGRTFRKRYTYEPDVDLGALERRFGRPAMERVYLHIAAFETIPLAALRPRSIDFGPLGRFATPALEAVWRRVLRGVGAQWRWENGLPHEPPPAWTPAGDAAPEPLEPRPGPLAALCFNGGGKDSLVMLRLLERAGLDYATLGYSHSTYGAAGRQHELIDGLSGHCAPRRRHRQWVEDDQWSDPEGVAAEFGVRSLICSETPISLFAAVPIALARGYRWLVLGNERSAEEGNFDWPATGEVVNHQWGKTVAAQRLLDRYLGEHLVRGLRYTSALGPVRDVVIFALLREAGDAVRATHSCSVAKPWCERCPKCAYVWAGYRAYLPEETIAGLFRGDPFDAEENRDVFRGLLGLGRPKPFECVGETGETRLAFALCRARGIRGGALKLAERAPPPPLEDAIARYATVEAAASPMPDELAAALLPRLREGAAAAAAYLERHLGAHRRGAETGAPEAA